MESLFAVEAHHAQITLLSFTSSMKADYLYKRKLVDYYVI